MADATKFAWRTFLAGFFIGACILLVILIIVANTIPVGAPPPPPSVVMSASPQPQARTPAATS